MESYIFILVAILIGTLLCKRGTTILSALQLSVMMYCFAWLGYLLLSGCTVLLEIILIFVGFDVHWSEVISNYKWIIQGIGYLILILAALSPSDNNGGKSTSYLKKSSDTSSHIRPHIPSANKSTPRVAARPISRKNLTNITNDMRKGMTVVVSFKDYCDTDLTELSTLAGKLKNKLILTNTNIVSLYQLANIVKDGRGYVSVDRIIDAGLDAEKFAEKGVCFTCDCRNRSTCIKDIAIKSRAAKGKVIFINCKHLTSMEIESLRSIGKDNIEVR